MDKQLSMPTSPTGGNMNLSFDEKMEVDARSVYIGNVDYAATAEELEQHFHGCGSINRSVRSCSCLVQCGGSETFGSGAHFSVWFGSKAGSRSEMNFTRFFDRWVGHQPKIQIQTYLVHLLILFIIVYGTVPVKCLYAYNLFHLGSTNFIFNSRQFNKGSIW